MKILPLILIAFGLWQTTAAARATNPTVYISTRTDGLPGTGTAANPFNGSTEPLFDALMKSIPANTTIELSAGTFLTDGADVFSIESGWVLNGAGTGTTVLKLVGHASNNTKHGHLSGNWVSNVTISNLTCDANYAGYKWPAHQAVGGILLVGSNNTVNHVELVNCYGDMSQGLEEFSILLCGTHQQTAVNLTIENCITHQYAPGSNYTNGPSLSSCTGSQIVACTDDGGNHGFGVSDGASNNQITDCASTLSTGVGVYTDTGTTADLTIENNNLAASVASIMFNSAQAADHVKILNNTLRTSNNTGSGEAAILLCGGGGGNDFQIDGNVYTYIGTNHSGLILNNGQHFTDLDVEDNSSNVGLVGGGGSTTDITNVATIVSGNRFNEPLADLADDNSAAGAPATPGAVTATASPSSGTSSASSTSAPSTASSVKTASTTTVKAATPTTTPQQTIAAIVKTPASTVRSSELEAAFVQWTLKSPASAAEYAQSMPPGPDRLLALDAVAAQWAATNAAAATEWVTSLPPDSEETQHVFHKVAETWAEQATDSSASNRPTSL